MPTVTETLSAPAMAVLLASPAQRAAHVTALVGLAAANGYDGVDLDYETMNSAGTVTDKAAVRSGFVIFLRELASALHAQGRLLSVTVGPRTRADDPNWAVFDYAGIAPSVDRFRLMTYDNHWRGGSPGAVAPLPWVNTVLTYAVTAVTRDKIEVGVPLYGYDWPADPAQPDGYGIATSRNYQQAEALRLQYAAVRQWSATDAVPYFAYTDPVGVKHVVWYNDADATRAKMTSIEKYGIRGLAFWAVGYEDARQWSVLRAYAIQKSTKLTVAAPATVTHGTTVTVSGRLTTTAGLAVPGHKVALQWHKAGTSTWLTVASGSSSSSGAVSLRYAPATNGSFRLQAPSSWSYLSSLSASISTLVRWRVSASFKDATVTRGTTVRLAGKVSPVRSGTAVRRQWLVSGAWTTVASATVRSDGTYLFSFTWRARGTYTYRVVAPGTALNTTGYSTTLRLRVS
ncbi:glycosyl hydrolase family 18 protein [Paractinoplanes hotanensis]|uniref:Glycosyl hydrolase family 18 protein n=1 Tax=Paractinoplanes hotanensis TaxID=2906497 RepID=A0ABT0YE78_9ACTN|nr:glycosyl hydrolase family 18 protein [Actinoplanes hotanensis]